MFPASILKDRAAMLQRARSFFAEKNILEVDCCAIIRQPSLDAHIDVMSVSVKEGMTAFLHTSPEISMKQLLSSGIGDIYYLGHVFRKGEVGRRHNPEFTMAEWYRVDFSLSQMIQETCEFLFLFLGSFPIEVLTYREVFFRYLEIDYTNISLEDLRKLIQEKNTQDWDRTTCLHFLLSSFVEPHLGKRKLTVLTDYPPKEAALAFVIEKDGEKVAERFEIYHEGVELTNGYHELNDPNELRRRFNEENKDRTKMGKPAYDLNEGFLTSLENNFPDCCGVSVGFDRALMLRHKKNRLSEVLPFSF
jgi:lysyl-tRNA synthetase class 2